MRSQRLIEVSKAAYMYASKIRRAPNEILPIFLFTRQASFPFHFQVVTLINILLISRNGTDRVQVLLPCFVHVVTSR